MANMSYCKFRNTIDDMSDCIDSLANYETCEPDEHRARIEFVRMCADVVFNFTGADSVDEAVAWAESLDVEE